MKKSFRSLASSLAVGALLPACPKAGNLIPTAPGAAPNYFCTWNVQGYVLNYAKGKLRNAMTEENMFGRGKYQNWVDFYPRIRGDLYFVMDDSWDVDFKNYDYGTNLLSPVRFPTYARSGTEREKFRKPNDAVKAKGWRAVGGWIAANKAKAYKDTSDHDFYAERLKWMGAAGWGYLKVDWGMNSKSGNWRRLTEWGRQHAPNIHVEHAMIWSCVPFSDVFRTYDVEVITAIPVTLSRVCKGITQVAEPGAKALINCEDEPVIGAVLGCTIGVMRHPFVGDLPDGKQDFAFPPVTRDVKRSLNEVERGILWHRVAPPLAVDGNVNIDEVNLEDSWCFQEREGWATTKPGKWSKNSAPARITRGGLPLPTVKVDGEVSPFVIASRHPNGTVSIATLGRTVCASPEDRKYGTPLAEITLDAGKLTGLIGVFGHYKSLTLTFDAAMEGRKVRAQDILGQQANDITSQVVIKENTVTIPGKPIDRIGLEKADRSDKSDPGMVISISGAEIPASSPSGNGENREPISEPVGSRSLFP